MPLATGGRGEIRSPLPHSRVRSASVPLDSTLIANAVSSSADAGKTLDFNLKNIGEVSEEATEELARIGRDDMGDEGIVTRLALSNNYLRRLPSNFATLYRLRYLNLRANAFVRFPDVVTTMPSLEILDLGRNKIQLLPAEPGTLVNLRKISLSKNRIAKLPAYIVNFTNLKMIKVDNNPIEWPPSSVVQDKIPPTDKTADMRVFINQLRQWYIANASPEPERQSPLPTTQTNGNSEQASWRTPSSQVDDGSCAAHGWDISADNPRPVASVATLAAEQSPPDLQIVYSSNGTIEASGQRANEGDDTVPTSIEGIISALARRGCTDLTSSIDLTTCSDHPCAGGGFCEVYQGKLCDGTRIAIKSLKVYGSQLERDREGQRVLKRATKELYHWSKLKHPNVLPLMGLAVFKGFISMISGWMENGDVPSYLQLKPDADRIRLCMDICVGLCYIHEKRMVHGDLKGANIMVSSDGIAMIADFGNARLKDLSLQFGNTTSRGLSVRWAAPELLLHDDVPQVSMEADVYAYGMTVLETLTSKVPYHGLSETRVLGLVFNREVPSRPGSGISNDMWALLMSCWAQTPTERPKIAHIGEYLEAILSLGELPGGA